MIIYHVFYKSHRESDYNKKQLIKTYRYKECAERLAERLNKAYKSKGYWVSSEEIGVYER